MGSRSISGPFLLRKNGFAKRQASDNFHRYAYEVAFLSCVGNQTATIEINGNSDEISW